MHGWTASFTAEAIPLSSTGQGGEPCVLTDGSQIQDPPWLVVGTHSSLREGGRGWGRQTWQRSLPSAFPPHHLGPTRGPSLEVSTATPVPTPSAATARRAPARGRWGVLIVPAVRHSLLFHSLSLVPHGLHHRCPQPWTIAAFSQGLRMPPPLQLEDAPLPHWVIAFAQNLAWVSPILKRSFPLPPAPGSVLLP